MTPTDPDYKTTGRPRHGNLADFFHGPRGGILLSLILIAVGVIVSVKSCSSPVANNGYEYTRAKGDTINVAIDYSPMSLYRYGDSLAGFNYEMMKQMATLYGDNVKFYPISSVTSALDELKRGVYDVVCSFVCGRNRKEARLDAAAPFAAEQCPCLLPVPFSEERFL